MHPDVSESLINSIVKCNYGLRVVSYQKYEGYSDLNYCIETVPDDDAENTAPSCRTCRKLVLKILNHEDSAYPECFETQLNMMLHLKRHHLPVPTPIVTITGGLYCNETFYEKETGTAVVRLVSLVEHLPGMTYREAGCPRQLLTEIGKLTGKIDTALKNFHGNTKNNNPWQLPKLPDLSEKVQEYCSSTDIIMGLDIIRTYEYGFLSVAKNLQTGIIHGDINTSNLIVEPLNSTTESSTRYAYAISGLVDFADANLSFYVYELAIVTADVIIANSCIDPTETIREILRGYVQEFPLNEAELSVLKLCICIRLLQNYVLRSHSLKKDPGNKYLDDGRIESLKLCRCIWQLNDKEFIESISRSKI